MSDAPPTVPMQCEPLRRNPRIAVIALTLGSTLECGTEVMHTTWAIGPTVNAAMLAWVKAHPKLVAKVKSRRVVSSWESRVEVLDARNSVPRRAYHAKLP